ncbi:DNA-3-methyladenine glycosylase [Luteococcus peritonei]|uniref:Putative 3-methyladenine DNA glycosylase n=1 Tax=Luteococcus peritonei TaxID=88874 RepID=A0ABW4RSR0_9ACTN
MIDLSRDPLEVAPELLGAVLCHDGVALRLTEVEAYRGGDDPASHAFRGVTPRTRVMFGPSAHLYVYLSYGIHLAANIVCGSDGTAGAVLLRAGEVVAGHELARGRRAAGRRPDAPPVPDHLLAKGPGCVGQALGLSLADSGAVVEQSDQAAPAPAHGSFLLLDGRRPVRTASGPRVGVSQAADHPWRFWEAGSPTVSSYSRSRRAAPPQGPL